MSTRLRRNFLLASMAYLVFIVYGSLVPLDYVPLPFDDAVRRFAEIPYLELGIGSRADWVANLLLFIPLSYLWLGATWRRGRSGWNAVTALLFMVCGAALSVGIEFVQIYFPQRTVSINDIVAEAAGAAIGVLLWTHTGPALVRWIEQQASGHTSTGWAERVLYVYVTSLYIYSVLPLDLTISPVEIYRKWAEGRVMLLPFGAHYASVADAIYDVGADTLIWVPVAALWRINGRTSAVLAVCRVVFAATLLEFLQLFVYSRITDTTDILSAMIGGAIGCALGGWLLPRSKALHQPTSATRPWGLWALGVTLWLCALALVFWYPFELRTDRAFVSERLSQVLRIPFTTYYFGSEFRAITELLHKMLFFMPGGALLGWAAWRAPQGPLRGAALLGTCLILSGIALIVELGQVLMPDKVSDATDWALETLGALLGTSVSWRWLARRDSTSTPDRSPERTQTLVRR